MHTLTRGTMSACLFFKMECDEAREDERVMVIGNPPELGMWDPVGGVVLEPDLASGGRPFWVSARVDFDLRGWTDLHFRFVIARMDAPIISGWEPGPGNGLREMRVCEGQCSEVSGSWEKAGWLHCRLMHSFFMDCDRQAEPGKSEEWGGQKQQSEMESSTESVCHEGKGVGEAKSPGAPLQSPDPLSTPLVYLQLGGSPTDVPPPPPSITPPPASLQQTHANPADRGTKPLFPLGLTAFAQTDVPTHPYTQNNPSTHERAIMQYNGGAETARRFAEVAPSFLALLSLKRPRDCDTCLHPDSDPFQHAIERLSEKKRDGVSVPISREGQEQKGARRAGVRRFASTGEYAVSARSVGVQAFASTGGSVEGARSAGVQAFASMGEYAPSARIAGVQAFASMGEDAVSARSAGERVFASTGGSVASARSAGVQAFASMGGSVASARSAGVQVFANTGDSVASARSAGVQVFASTGGCVAGARSAGVLVFASTGGCVAGARSAGVLAFASTGEGAPDVRSAASEELLRIPPLA
uniref:CBM20 domain-containing protein n=1 Tax=Chromera velia CCMP2878 TaxID=1169474 RepID=A0A0G4IAL9_9ALVE|eukprot:Cvel_12597.t1-p1 / transcript=Cvel_12597.t1 / gene=Cvel_12597 / organism=Chromera_velia_CCMP2878 / gene_product=Zinc finger protein 571, putative / transcript_product=Zinc finger protein 571, putative / location=Cvel_scaffold831:16235-20613(+) / protein_length=528 / sequence_SO=supercontig / SO=protein_coding / is_pseudo=false